MSNMNVTSIVKQREGVKAVRLLLEQQKDQLKMALPRHITPERMLRVVMTNIQRNPKLLECEQLSLLGAIFTSAQLGLECDGVMGQAYLIPYWNSKNRQTEVQFQPGYKGLLNLARRSGEVARVETKVVCEKDDFEYEFGLHANLRFRPSQEDERGKVTHVYALVVLKDGSPYFDVWAYGQIEKHRKQYSKASESGPWVSAWDEMAKKTVLKSVLKLCPMSVEYQQAHSLDDLAESGLPQNLDLNLPPQVAESIPEPEEPKSKLDAIVDKARDTPSEDEIQQDLDRGTARPAEQSLGFTEADPSYSIDRSALLDTIEAAKDHLTKKEIADALEIHGGRTPSAVPEERCADAAKYLRQKTNAKRVQ